MESTPRYFRALARKPSPTYEAKIEVRATRIRRHGDKPNGGNRGRFRITARNCR